MLDILLYFYLFEDLEHLEGREATREAEKQRLEAKIKELVRVTVAREVTRLRTQWEFEDGDQ